MEEGTDLVGDGVTVIIPGESSSADTVSFALFANSRDSSKLLRLKQTKRRGKLGFKIKETQVLCKTNTISR